MKSIAIIPARSGSKGLPDKNIRPVNGKPLMAYTIEAAVQSGCFDTVHVSTDSEKYAEIGRSFGADIPFLRDPGSSTDTASTWTVMSEVLEKYRKIGKTFDSFMILQPTSPLRTARHIREAFALLEEKNGKSVVAVCEAEHSPLKFNTIPEDGSLARFSDRRADRPRQQIETYYLINGAIYLVRTENGTEFPKDVYSDRCYGYRMDRRDSVDVDDEDDLAMVEFLLSRRDRCICR